MIMRWRLSPRDRRTLAIGIGTIVGLIFLSHGVPAMSSWRIEGEARRAALRERVEFLREVRPRRTQLRDTLAARRRRVANQNAQLITASSASSAAAALGAHIEDLARDAEVTVTSLEPTADSMARSSLIHVSVRVSAEGDIVGLAAFLSTVERDREPMAVRSMSISSTDPMPASDKVEVLRFDVRIDGLALVTTARVR
ncbi:MAG TPA: type II secretion system protein GspM [Gemmatimonadaceae bacterium]|jgi:hypothetical protein